MGKSFYLASFLALASFCSCQEDIVLGDDSLNKSVVEISATIENGLNSRTQLDGTANNGVNWSANDKISVFLGNTSNKEFTLDSGEGTGNATFKGSGDVHINAGTETNTKTQANVAYYPYADDVTLSCSEGYQINADFPAAQAYVENSFGQSAAPMVAVTKDNYDNAFQFKNVGSIFKVKLKKGTDETTISKVTLSSKAHKLAGKYTVTASNSDEPTFEFADEAVNTIALNCGEGVALTEEGVTFVFAIPYQKYANGDLTFTFYTSGGDFMTFKSEKEYDIKRSTSWLIDDKTYEKSGSGYPVTGAEALQAALNSSTNPMTVVLSENITLTEPLTIPSDKTFTLDLNGYKLSYTDTQAGTAMITNNGTLTIKDTSAEADGKITYSYTGEADTSYGKGNYTIFNNGTLSLESGVIENTTAAMSHASYAINTGDGATLTINGGKVLNLNGHAVRMASSGLELNQMTFNGGYIEGTRAIQMQLLGTSSSDAPKMSLTIAGGELKSNEETYNFAVYVYSNGQSGENVSLSVTDGVINGNIAINGAATTAMKDGAVSVSGGTINGEYGVFSYDETTGGLGKISITGGTFKSNNYECHAAPGYAFVQDGDVYKVQKDATKAVVTSLEDLNAALANTEITTIQLDESLTLSDILVIGRAITLDGNGKTLTSSASRAINVSGANGVTIKNLTIDCSGERAINIIQNATNVTIDNVTATASNYTVNVASSAPGAVVAIKNSTLTGCNVVNVAGAGADVAVTNSTINCNDENETVGESYAALCLNKDAVGGKITATGCTINVTEGSDSSKGGNSAENGTVTIDNSTDDVQINVAYVQYGNYYYSYPTLAAAFEHDASDGNTIVLMRDIVLSETLTIPAGKTFTLDLNGKIISQEKQCTASYQMITNKGNLTIKGNGKISFEDTGVGAPSYGWGTYTMVNYGVMVIENGVIENTTSIDGHMYDAIDNHDGATLTINGGTVKCENYVAIRMFASSEEKDNTVVINKAEIIGKFPVWPQNTSNGSKNPKATLDVDGATIKGNIYLGSSNNFNLTADNAKFEVSSSAGLANAMALVGENCQIQMAAGTYEAIEFGPRAWDLQTGETYKYARTIKSLTVKSDAEVTIGGLNTIVGHVHSHGGTVDVVAPNGANVNSTGYYSTLNLENITFEGLGFEGNVLFSYWNGLGSIDGIKFIDCSFNMGGTDSGKGACIQFGAGGEFHPTNINITGCKFTNAYQGVLVHQAGNVTITNSEFSSMGHNAIQTNGTHLDSGDTYYVTGNISITGNTFSTGSDRAIRSDYVAASAKFVITGNSFSSYCDEDGQVMKSSNVTSGATYEISDNKYEQVKMEEKTVSDVTEVIWSKPTASN